MLQIKKMQNVFGISGVEGANDLKKINVVYAPNGTAKTSISDALSLIGQNRYNDIVDVYDKDKKASFELEVDGQDYTEENCPKFCLLKYSGIEQYDLVENCSNLVISIQAKEEISEYLKAIDHSKEAIKVLIEGKFGKRSNSPAFKNAFSAIAKVENFDDQDLYIKLINKINFDEQPLPINVDENIFLNLINQKMQQSSDTPEFKTGVTDYFETIKKSSNEAGRHEIFTNSFTIESLIAFQENAKKTGYYSEDNPTRKLFIDNKILGEKDIDNIINDEIKRIFGNEEAKEKFDCLKKTLKGNTKAINTLEKNPLLIPLLKDYDCFVSSIFVTLFSTDLQKFKNELEIIKKAQSNIQAIKDKDPEFDSKISEIWNRFSSRFKLKKFDLRIDNKFNAMIGKEIPSFSKYIPNTNRKITDPKEYRLSTDEIKIYNLINFILTVETLLLKNEKVHIVLDDAVDSFDYKNKYGIIDYLLEIKDNPNVQIIIFTHNFDFYRSSILAFGKKEIGQFFAYRDKNNLVTFYDSSKQKYYLEVSNFNSWKANPTPEQFFALVPFARNLLQLKTSSKNDAVKQIDDFLHFNKGLTDKTIGELHILLERAMGVQLPRNFKHDDIYAVELSKTIDDLIDKEATLVETDLEDKILLGIYIRVYLERFLYINHLSQSGSKPDLADNVYARTSNLIRINRQFLSEDDLDKTIEANLISPCYLHANSFMYEPLVDVGLTELIEMVKWIRDKNKGLKL